MPQYFFHIESDTHRLEDGNGAWLPSIEMARREARATARIVTAIKPEAMPQDADRIAVSNWRGECILVVFFDDEPVVGPAQRMRRILRRRQ